MRYVALFGFLLANSQRLLCRVQLQYGEGDERDHYLAGEDDRIGISWFDIFVQV
jgi:hypothetical protein